MANNYTLFSIELAVTDDEAAWFEALSPEDDDTFWSAYSSSGYPPCEIKVVGDKAYLFADESGEPDGVASLLQVFLREKNPTGSVGFEVAFTCSKPRPDEFGGAAWFITAKEIRSFDTSSWLAQQEV